MLALVVVLKLYSDRPIPHWRGHITLNAFISVTSTIMKVAIAVPIAASISQMKWIRFKERNPIRGIQVYDEASRGPLGALKVSGVNPRLISHVQLAMALSGRGKNVNSALLHEAVRPIANIPSVQRGPFYKTISLHTWCNYGIFMFRGRETAIEQINH